MRLILLTLVLAGIAQNGCADTVVATRNIRAHTILTEIDLGSIPTHVAGGFEDPALLLGQEARRVLYAGRPILRNDIGAPALVERNQIVRLVYLTGPLTIYAEGRSLGRAGLDDRIRVINLSSRATITGQVTADGSVLVTNTTHYNQ